MSRRRLIVVGPVPPPLHGVAVSTQLVLGNEHLRERFEVLHLDTSDRRSRENIGRWDRTNVRLGLAGLYRLVRMLGGRPGILYVPISQSAGGFCRDALFVYAARAKGWKVAAHLRGSELHLLYRRSRAPLRRVIRSTMTSLDSVAVMGESVRHAVADLVPASKVAVVPNGTPDFGGNGRVHDDSTVLFLSNLLRRKGVREALEAALVVVERHPSAHFVFAGEWEDDALRTELQGAAAAADGRITFLAPVDEERKRELLQSSAILLFPPLLPEGHPRVVLEALSAGLPVVTTDRGTLADTVGDCGYVLPSADPIALAESVTNLLTDDSLRAELSRRARAQYLARFTQPAADRQLADWLREIAG